MLSVCATWFARGQGKQFKIATRWGSHGRLNLLGTLSLHRHHQQLEYRLLDGNCTRAKVIDYLRTLAQRCDPTKLTVVILDNAAYRKGGELEQRRAGWEAKGLYLRYLPAYCPFLNLIETTWCKLKGFLMPRRCYDSLTQLRDALLAALKLISAVEL